MNWKYSVSKSELKEQVEKVKLSWTLSAAAKYCEKNKLQKDDMWNMFYRNGKNKRNESSNK